MPEELFGVRLVSRERANALLGELTPGERSWLNELVHAVAGSPNKLPQQQLPSERVRLLLRQVIRTDSDMEKLHPSPLHRSPLHAGLAEMVPPDVEGSFQIDYAMQMVRPERRRDPGVTFKEAIQDLPLAHAQRGKTQELLNEMRSRFVAQAARELEEAAEDEIAVSHREIQVPLHASRSDRLGAEERDESAEEGLRRAVRHWRDMYLRMGQERSPLAQLGDDLTEARDRIRLAEGASGPQWENLDEGPERYRDAKTFRIEYGTHHLQDAPRDSSRMPQGRTRIAQDERSPLAEGSHSPQGVLARLKRFLVRDLFGVLRGVVPGRWPEIR